MSVFVPVRASHNCLVLRLFRTPLGERTAVAFTSEQRLVATFGPDQAWTLLSEPFLRHEAARHGVALLTVDPTFAAPAPQPLPAPSVWCHVALEQAPAHSVTS